MILGVHRFNGARSIMKGRWGAASVVGSVGEDSSGSPPYNVFVFFNSRAGPFGVGGETALFGFVRRRGLVLGDVREVRAGGMVFGSMVTVLVLSGVSGTRMTFSATRIMDVVGSYGCVFRKRVVSGYSFRSPDGEVVCAMCGVRCAGSWAVRE